MLLSLVLSAFIVAVVLLHRKDNTFSVQMEFVFGKTRIPFCKTKYKNWQEFEFVQDQLTSIALSEMKNRFFRDIGISAFSLTGDSGEEFFYVQLKKPL